MSVIDILWDKWRSSSYDYKDLAIIIELSCGARITEVLDLAEFTLLPDRPDHILQVMIYLFRLTLFLFFFLTERKSENCQQARDRQAGYHWHTI